MNNRRVFLEQAVAAGATVFLPIAGGKGDPIPEPPEEVYTDRKSVV